MNWSGKLLHFISHSTVAVLVTLIWHLVDAWTTQAPSSFAGLMAIAVSIGAGIALSHILHEWGHFLGAFGSGARYRLKSNISPLFFDFDYAKNTPRHYLCMSVGGPLGNVFAIGMALLLLPMTSLAQHWLLATLLGQFVYVLVLEGPVSIGIMRGGNPMDVLSQHFGQGKPLFQRSLLIGVVCGVVIALTMSY